MKILTAIILALATSATAQTNPPPPTFIKGTMEIQFNSVTKAAPDGSVPKGVSDIYTLDLNVCNSALFKGTITQLPYVAGGWVSSAQVGQLTYDVSCDIMNPNNPRQVKAGVGRIHGIVPMDKAGNYLYDAGDLEIHVEQIGSAPEYHSQFKGTVQGKPPVKAASMADSLSQAVAKIRRSIHGQTVIMEVKNYDVLNFKDAILAGGPLQVYPDATVNGRMLYDGARAVWYFDGLRISYGQHVDTITGNIKWVKAADRRSSGLGHYDFDIRVNEPPPSEDAAFSSTNVDEAAFFQTDATIPSLTGTMSYKDTIANAGDASVADDDLAVTASSVTFDLQGNRLSKQQVMNLCKLVVFEAIVPMNDN